MGIIVVAVLAQYFFPRHLLTGPAIALALTMAYLILQKPEDMLDQLTGVFARGAMLLYVQDSIREKREYQVIMIKLNNMYRIDRLLGFAAGNQIMRDIGRYLFGELGARWVFRPSSTRFVVITNDAGEQRRMLALIQERFKSPWDIQGYNIKVFETISFMPDTSPVGSTEELVELMEYAARELPRGELAMIDNVMLERVNRQSEVENALLSALQRDALEVYYQPIYSVRGRTFVGAEALVRFPYKGKMIAPDEFIPIAERNMSVIQLDEMVTRRVCEFIRRHDPASLGIAHINVNLSAVEFVYEGLDRRIAEIIRQYGVPPDMLAFEITETTATSEHGKLQCGMSRMREQGFSFVLDDFGTGYANISRVVRLPFTAAKLDRELLLASEQNEKNDTVYRMSADMFKTLGLSTVAEGVETAEQARWVTDIGVDYVQGYYFARPMPAEKFLEFLQQQRNR